MIAADEVLTRQLDNLDELSFEKIRLWTNFFRRPLVIQIKQSVETKLNEKLHEWQHKEELLLGGFHTGTYWSSNPIQQEFSGRQAEFRVEEIFQFPGRYYTTPLVYHKKAWRTRKATPPNYLDDEIVQLLPTAKSFQQTVAGQAWLSGGGTKTPTHSDPLHNLMFQLEGRKELIIFSQNLAHQKYKDHRNPHFFALRSIKDLISSSDFAKKFFRISLEPGTLLFIPAWWFHCVETPASQLNLTLTSFFAPSPSYRFMSSVGIRALFYRRIYPRLFRKARRLAYARALEQSSSRPYFPLHIKLAKHAAINPNWNVDAFYYLIDIKNRRTLFIKDPLHMVLLTEVDGKKTLSDFGDVVDVDPKTIRSVFAHYIHQGFLEADFLEPSAVDLYNLKQVFNEY